MAVYGKADSWEYTQKYTKLAQKLKSHFVIHLGGCQVSNKNIIDIVERAKPYSSKVVMDVLMKHLSLSYAKQSLTEEGKKSVFFYTKFVASLSRNYSKFSKISAKETHMFVELFGGMTHSLSGIETCRCIAPHILASEAQRVAVMLYEYHMKL
ncbi:BnaC09g17700D [Brassica napus]|uniref:BnaC09g17700D protein n=2 Tax=Brassica TaxID=3705 RepID=A0A078HHU2_BRANA|nr:BnaC09g17700D [Brassica napus]VDD30194.1 unnamed protein product [Brassica oleracea]